MAPMASEQYEYKVLSFQVAEGPQQADEALAAFAAQGWRVIHVGATEGGKIWFVLERRRGT